MHGQAFAERTRLADQYAAPVAQRAVERFHDAGLATALGTGPVGSGRQHRRVRFPGIGVIRRIVLITSRQLLEEPPARSRTPAPSPRCAARRAQRPATARPYACACRRRSTFRPTPAPPPPLPLWPRPRPLQPPLRQAFPTRLFFTHPAIVIRDTPVARTMLRCELRSTNSFITCSYCVARRGAAGVKTAWWPQS